MIGAIYSGLPLAALAMALLAFLAWRALMGPKLSPLELRRAAFQVLGAGIVLLTLGLACTASNDEWLRAFSLLLVRLGLVMIFGGAVQYWRSQRKKQS